MIGYKLIIYRGSYLWLRVNGGLALYSVVGADLTSTNLSCTVIVKDRAAYISNEIYKVLAYGSEGFNPTFRHLGRGYHEVTPDALADWVVTNEYSKRTKNVRERNIAIIGWLRELRHEL